jgi:uncharacterized paraquat-inducible protein A
MMRCPQCDNSILPFKVWLISRWYALRCDRCGAMLKRAIDRQLALVSVLFFAGIFMFVQTPLVLIGWLVVVMLVDAYTVRLVPDKTDGPGKDG